MAKLILIAGGLAIAFGWWGQYTAAGRHRFDEMDGIIPEAALVAGVVVVLATALYLFFRQPR